MSILDDFFGDSRTAKKECLFCGLADEPLDVEISDAYGPTHWIHPDCRVTFQQKCESQTTANSAAVYRQAYTDWMEEGRKIIDYLPPPPRGNQYSDQVGIDEE